MTDRKQQRVEYTIVCALLNRDDGHERGWTVAELVNDQRTAGAGGVAVHHALGELHDYGVAIVWGDRVAPSAALLHLEALGLVAV